MNAQTPTPPRRFRHRASAVDHIRTRLLRESYPRTQMALIVALTGGFGLLASFTMLHPSVDSMALRRTIIPFVLTAIFLGVAGHAMQIHAPGAKSIGQVMPRGN